MRQTSMEAQTVAPPQPATISSCIEHYGSLLGRFEATLDTLENLADRLHGAQPTAVGVGGKDAAAHSIVLIRDFQSTNQTLHDLLDRFSRITERFGDGL
jgi:hypothetical protein